MKRILTVLAATLLLTEMCIRDSLQGVGVQALQKVLVGGVRVRVGEQVVVQPHLRVDGGGGIHPMDGGTPHLPAVSGVAAPALRVVLRQHLGDAAA